MQIQFNNVSYFYGQKSPMATRALYDIDLRIESGKYTAIIGQTGSGKSTLLQHLNALLIPSSGSMQIGERTIHSDVKNKSLKPLRQKVGIVFQFPEYQLFEETVEKDICFGPMNYGASLEEAKAEARKLVLLLGLDESILQRSPLELSGGQMRRVAIAGILAMKPSVLVLDEPTAGLDPRGSREIMEMFARLQQQLQLTVVLVSHSMEDVARYAKEIIVLDKGTIFQIGTPTEIFSRSDELLQLGLNIPKVVEFQRLFEKQSGCRLSKMHVRLEDLVREISQVVKRVEGC